MYLLILRKVVYCVVLFVVSLFALNYFNGSGNGDLSDSVISIKNTGDPEREEEETTVPSLGPKNVSHTVKSGDTLYSILTSQGITPAEVAAISKGLKRSKITQTLHVGQVVDMYFDKNGKTENLFIYGNRKGNVLIKPSGDLFVAAIEEFKTLKHIASVESSIASNFYRDAARAGADSSTINSFIKNFSYLINFQRDIRHGDKFVIKFEQERAEDGRIVRSGPIQYASLTSRGKTYEIYRYKSNKGSVQYVDASGMPVKRTMLQRPVGKARISSGFGMRMHPIHRRRIMHQGIDYAAPSGTPIVAAGDGVITFVKSSSRGYGKHIKVKHNSTYSTLYGHMSRFAKGMRSGSKVKQGQVIGYVGATGGATGPHLHYEVHRNGKQINPIKVTFTKPQKLNSNEMKMFAAQKSEINKKFNIS